MLLKADLLAILNSYPDRGFFILKYLELYHNSSLRVDTGNAG
jgi:hypothetical protein